MACPLAARCALTMQAVIWAAQTKMQAPRFADEAQGRWDAQALVLALARISMVSRSWDCKHRAPLVVAQLVMRLAP